MADADDPAATTYPQSSVEPLLPNEKTACNSQLPGGEVVEWFDFGQFVELLAVDAAGKSHPVVLANHEELARAAGEIGQGDAVPLRMVDIVGGIPLTEIADEDRGSGERALAPIAAAREIIVGDVDALIATGAITVGGITYKVTLTQDEARRLRDGEHITHAARASEGAVTRDVIVSPAPTGYDARVADVEALLAARTVEIVRDSGQARVPLALERGEFTAMLAASTVIVRATAGEATVLVRLTQLPGAAERPPAHPARTENQIDDVAAFLANPVVDGDDGRPFPLQLTKEPVHELRTNGTGTIQLDDRQVTVSTVRVQTLASTVRVQTLQQRNGGTEPNGGKEPKEREEPPPTPSPKEQTTETVTVLTAGSVEA